MQVFINSYVRCIGNRVSGSEAIQTANGSGDAYVYSKASMWVIITYINGAEEQEQEEEQWMVIAFLPTIVPTIVHSFPNVTLKKKKDS